MKQAKQQLLLSYVVYAILLAGLVWLAVWQSPSEREYSRNACMVTTGTSNCK